MKTDLYTKVVLTVIALALVCLVFQNFDVVTSANASNTTSSISELSKTNDVIQVRVVNGSWEAIPVTVKN
ncbi:MAG: hypothetical protein LBL58_08450 [Tannerellaceae bacterium]|jgi:hypothetical protein|nr:hypothetical protein [Tannerellaceae bacterium]